jgi:hypothetical protein
MNASGSFVYLLARSHARFTNCKLRWLRVTRVYPSPPPSVYGDTVSDPRTLRRGQLLFADYLEPLLLSNIPSTESGRNDRLVLRLTFEGGIHI